MKTCLAAAALGAASAYAQVIDFYFGSDADDSLLTKVIPRYDEGGGTALMPTEATLFEWKLHHTGL